MSLRYRQIYARMLCARAAPRRRALSGPGRGDLDRGASLSALPLRAAIEDTNVRLGIRKIGYAIRSR